MEDQEKRPKNTVLKKIRKIILWIIGSVLLLLIAVFLLFKIPAVQNWAAQKATAYLSNKLQTRVEIGDVTIDLFRHVVLNEIYIEDLKGDTLLYARSFEVNLGSINPFRSSVKIKNITLESGFINLYRNNPDTVFNYAFVMDAFASHSEDTSASKPADIDLQKINISDTRFSMHDEPGLSNFDVYIGETEARINELNLPDHILGIESFSLDKSDISLTVLLDPQPEEDTISSPENYDTVHIAIGDWVIEANAFTISQSSFFYHDENVAEQADIVNFSDLAITGLDVDIAEFVYVGDTISAAINKIALQDKSGFKLDELHCDLLFSPYEITLNDLDLKTPYSDIKNRLSLKFTTLNDFDRFFSDIHLNADIKNSIIDTKDLAYFVPELKTYPAVLALSTTISGTIDNLKLKNLNALLNNAAGISGEATLRGLPDIDNTYIDVQMKPMYADMAKLNVLTGSNNIPQNLIELGTVKYTGRFTGFINDFVLTGSLQSSAGNAVTDISFQYDKSTKVAKFEGKLQTQNLNIGKLTGYEDLIGEISTNAEIKGELDNKKLKTTLEASVDKVTLNGYTYSNIKIKGKVDDKLFDGYVLVDDPNLQQEFTGKLDFNNPIPTYDFVSEIKYINLGKLNLYKGDISVSVKTSINLSGKTVDDLHGNALITDITISNGQTNYALDTFQVTAAEDSGMTELKVISDLIEADFKGNYSLARLPSAIKDMINIYINGGDISSVEMQNAQNVDFTVQVKDIRPVAQIFYPEIKDVKNLRIEGELNTVDKKFYSRTTAEKFIYGNINFSATAIEIFTKNNKLSFFVSVKQTDISDNLTIPITVVEGDFSQDSLNINLKVGKDTDPERLNLTAAAYLSDSSISISFLPSEIYLSNEKWSIKANNSLFYDYKTFIAENFTLENGEKSISLSSTADNTYGTLLKVQLKNILIEDITQLIKYDATEISGSISASVNLSGNFSKPGFVALGSINNLMVSGETIGNTDINASLIYPNKKVNFNVMVKGENTMRVYGYYNIGGSDSLSVDAEISKIPLTIAEPFVTGIFSDMYGNISGNITVRGTASKPDARGSLDIKKGGLKVDYLGSQFDFAEQKISITKDKITLEPSILTDKYKNEASLTGSISHNNFNDIYFNNITLKGDRLLIMETTQKQNSTLFGKVVAQANVVVSGPLENMNIQVDAKTLKDDKVESVVYLPVYGSGNISKHDFIKFVDRSDTTKAVIIDNTVSVVNFDMRLSITPDAKIVILLSSEGSDTLVARGTGNLSIQANTIDKLEIYNTLTITEGSYNFSFENLVQKEFIMQPGGTIKFQRDPYKAYLDLTAVYTAEKVKRNTLTGDLTDQQLVNVDILIHITGNLESPEINFGLETSSGSSGSLSTFDQRLQQVQEDKNELNKQVFGLLVANQFLGQDVASAGGNSLQSGVSSTMSEFISNQLSRYFTDWLSEIFPNAEIDIKQTTIQSNEIGASEDQRQQFDFAVKQKLLDDALTIVIGGTYDYTQSTTATNSSNLAGDFEVDYNISKDGSVKVKAFRKSEYDVIGAKNDIKTGLGLFYTKDFNTFSELFAKKEKQPVTKQ